MPRRRLTVTIDKPVDAVFAVLSDVEKTSAWHPNTVREYWTSDGPVGVGSTRHAVAKSFGVRAENEAVVTVFDPGKALGLRSIDSPIPFSIHIGFEPTEAGTQVEWIVDMEASGPYRLIGSLAISAFMRQLELGLNQLGSLMDSGEL